MIEDYHCSKEHVQRYYSSLAAYRIAGSVVATVRFLIWQKPTKQRCISYVVLMLHEKQPIQTSVLSNHLPGKPGTE